MKITLICVGKIKERFFREGVAEYGKRLSRYCKLEIEEVADEKTPDAASETEKENIREKEGERILRLLKEDSCVIALDSRGEKLDSVGFGKKIEWLGVRGKSHLTFIIGGSLGLSQKVKDRAELSISFSDMTFPHQLMRIILLEQIYRGFRIVNGEPYHK